MVAQFVDDDLPVSRRDDEPDEIPILCHGSTPIDQKIALSITSLTP